MKKLILLFALLSLLLAPVSSRAIEPGLVNATEVDTSPSCWIYKLIFPNASLTCNADNSGTVAFMAAVDPTGKGLYLLRANTGGTGYELVNTLTGITIAGDTASKGACWDSSKNLVACTNLTDLAFSSYVAKVDTIRIATFSWDGGGSTLSTGTGTKICTTITHAATINGWHLTIDTSGAIVAYVFKDAWSTSAVPTTAIDASEHPTITASAVGAAGSAVGWTTSVTAYDNICAYVYSVTSATKANLVIHGTR